MTEPHRPTPSPIPPVRLETLLEDFVWLRLIRAPMLALAPSRWVIALLAVLAISILREAWGDHLLTRIAGQIARPALAAAANILTLDFGGAVSPLHAARAGVLGLLIEPPGPGAILLALPEFIIWLLAGTTICRMVALDFARGEPTGPTAGLRFGLGRLPAALGAVAAPLLVVAGLGAIVAIGWLLAAIPVVDIVVAALSVLALLMSLLAVLLVVFTILGAPLMLAAIACDGADAADAVQRAWAYLLSRPIQLLAAALAAVALGLVLVGVVGWIVEASVAAMQGWAGAWSDRAGEIATGADIRAEVSGAEPDSEGGTARAASWLAGMWIEAARAAVVALAVSYFFTAATLIYLLVRQSCDGQDYTDLWSPGATEALIAEALRARVDASGLDPGPDGHERLGAKPVGQELAEPDR
jgi:hypothetical protein